MSMGDIHTEIETHYCPESDMTFITRATYDIPSGYSLVSMTCIGWYFGEPNSRDTNEYADSNLTAYFD